MFRHFLSRTLVCTVAAVLPMTAIAGVAEPPPLGTIGDGSPPEDLLDSFLKGKLFLNVRARAELAGIDGDDDAQALTLRTRIGYATAKWEGLNFFVELENTSSVDDELYNSPGNPQPGESTIADPTGTELNQLYVDYLFDPAKTQIRLGRQRIILDDARFVGNVGWRQNEQTFDGLFLQNKSIEDLVATYALITEVNRIFFDPAGGGSDFDSDASHLINVAYSGLPFGKLVGFIYLLDFENSAANSSQTYGLLLTGKTDLDETLTLFYKVSVALQSDFGDNNTDYDALYYVIEPALGVKDVGKFIVGYEVLGSDNGNAQFRTPLATAHKFNGFADAFLDNGGADGLQDIYVKFAPANLPYGIKGVVAFHQFFDDEDGDELGYEIDVVASKKITNNLTALVKYAIFDGKEDADRYRLTFDLTFAF
ncbi:MAG: alginate export family protein [Planctomycetota bacterium]